MRRYRGTQCHGSVLRHGGILFRGATFYRDSNSSHIYDWGDPCSGLGKRPESEPLRCWIICRRVTKMSKDKIILPDPANISPEEIAPIMAQMAAIQLSLAACLIAEKWENPQDESDTLLTVEEAAARLKCSADWLYRRSKSLSFAVRIGRSLRFSEHGIDEAIRSGRRFA
jgi:excisionase family DNA binding protein